jgi:predicted small integral membrane protein
MSYSASLWLFQMATACGLALWMTVAVINNLHGFAASKGAIGLTMAMKLLQEEPFRDLPFLKRAIESTALHGAALVGAIILQIASAIPLLAGTVLLAASPGSPATAAISAIFNLGLVPFLLCWSLMFTSGLWFGFWIRQEGLLLTQLLLALWGFAGFAVLNAGQLAG